MLSLRGYIATTKGRFSTILAKESLELIQQKIPCNSLFKFLPKNPGNRLTFPQKHVKSEEIFSNVKFTGEFRKMNVLHFPEEKWKTQQCA